MIFIFLHEIFSFVNYIIGGIMNIDFQESKTKENLARSFAAECQEGARYQFMAKMARFMGMPVLYGL